MIELVSVRRNKLNEMTSRERAAMDPAIAIAAASELRRQHSLREPFKGLSGELAPGSVETAYQVQDAYVARLLQERGTTLRGYKIAITTPAMRDMVGFDDSVSGRLCADQILQSGQTISHLGYGRLIVEFEIAFQMARDLPATAAPWNGATIFEHVECAYPALEIADDRGADYSVLNQSILTLIADNAWNQGLVLGAGVKNLDRDFLRDVQGIAFIDGKEVGRGTGKDVLGHPLDALAWLANHLSDRGLSLRQGDLVTTGSLVKSQFPVAKNRIFFSLPGFGEVSLEIGG
jgi:2-keto-4-pentenoate hydratase